MSREPESSPLESRRGPLAIAEAALWTFSLVVLAIVGWSLVDSARFQSVAKVQLEAIGESGVQPPSADAGGTAHEAGPIAAGTPLASLEIPRLGIEAVVAEGDSARVLRRAVGRLPHSARLGEVGNVALAGHRDTFFRGLGEIAPDDVIVLTAGADRFVYRVEWTRVVEPDAVDVLRPTEEAALTLITCYPFRWIGPAPQRFVVRARRIDAAVNAWGGPCGDAPFSETAC